VASGGGLGWGWANGAADFVHDSANGRRRTGATFKAPITLIIVSLGVVRFRRAAAPMEAKIRSIGTMQLPHSHRILVGSVLVSGCGLSLRELATPDLDLIKQAEQVCSTATSRDFAVAAVDGPVAGGCSFMIRVLHAAAAI